MPTNTKSEETYIENRSKVTPGIIRKLIDYNKKTGQLKWKPRSEKWFNHCKNPVQAQRSWNSRYAGKVAFTEQTEDGYKRGKIFSHHFRASRVAYAHYHGKHPLGVIDHKNHKKGDDRICNLKDVSHGENGRNNRKYKSNSTGYTGVSIDSSRKKYRAAFTVDGIKHHVGYFTTARKAHLALIKARKKNGSFSSNHGKQK